MKTKMKGIQQNNFEVGFQKCFLNCEKNLSKTEKMKTENLFAKLGK
jgi:hypothetical protein